MGSGVLLVLSIGQLCMPRRTKENKLLSLLLFVCFVWLTHSIGYQLGMLDVYPHLNKVYIPFLALSGPLWYLYVHATLYGSDWTKADKRHTLPAILSTLLAIPFFLQPDSFKREYIEVIFTGPVSVFMYMSTRIAELTAIGYLAISLRELWLAADYRKLSAFLHAFTRKESPQPVSHFAMLVLTLLAFIASVVRLFGSTTGSHFVGVYFPSFLMLLAFLLFYWLSHRIPGLMGMGLRPARIKPATHEGKKQLQEYRKRIQQEGWHLDPNLKIQQVARRLGVPVQKLSELINLESGSNFNNFINQIRIDHAKRLLLDCKEVSVLDVAHASGFNSSSAFYSQFTRIESVTPAAFRSQAADQE